MGDPLTMAMIGAGVGAVTNPKKPLQGALLGGALGGFGGAAMGAGNVAATAAGTTAGGVPLAVTGATKGTQLAAAPLASTNAAFSSAAPFANPTMQGMSMQVANKLPMANPTMPGIVSTNASTGLIPSTTADVTMMDRLRAMGQFNRENPMVGQVGSSAFQSLNEPQPMAAATQPGLLRGNPIPMEQQQTAMLQQPQISLI
jgi:hypothetical protein